MKILGKIFIFLVFAAIVSVVYYWQVSNQPIANIPTKVVSPNKIYENEEYGFQVSYNKQYLLNTDGNDEHYFKTGGKALASISLPHSLYENTNFGSAKTTIAAKNKSSETDCKILSSGSSTRTMTQTVSYGSNTYHTYELSGAALGTRYDTKLYRIWHEPYCFELNLTVGISNIGNYDPEGNIIEVHFEELFKKLEPMLRSFKFLGTPAELVSEGPTGEIRGHVTASSSETYELVQIIVYSMDKNKIVTKANVSTSGNYFIELPVGDYHVTYTSIYNSFQPPLQKISITADKTTIVNFSIE